MSMNTKLMTKGHNRPWVLLLLGLTLLGSTPVMAADGRVTDAMGEVERGRGTPLVFESIEKGDPVSPGDVIRTGRGGRIELVLGAGTVRLYENSLLRVPANPMADHAVELKKGRSIFDVLKSKVTDRYEVKTPEVVVSVKGTRFEVDLAGTLAEVAVFRGTVGVRAPDTALELETLVREGFAAMGKRDMPFELDMRPRTDPWENWADLNDVRQTAMDTTRIDRQMRLEVDAQAAARRSSAKDLIGIATARNPEVAKRVAELRREQAAALAEQAKKADSASPDAIPAAIDPNGNSDRPGRGHGAMKNIDGMRADINPSDLMARMQSERHRRKEMEALMNPGEMGGSMEMPEVPGGGCSSCGWDPTPNLLPQDVMALGLPMSFGQILQMWTTAIGEIYQTDPSVFQNPDPSLYQAALLQKFDEAGVPMGAAQNLVDYIMSQIGSGGASP